jgi:hypothetical protein
MGGHNSRNVNKKKWMDMMNKTLTKDRLRELMKKDEMKW